VLGDHIAQRGSLVAPDRLRFDFLVHQKPILDELRRVRTSNPNNVVSKTMSGHTAIAVGRRPAKQRTRAFGENTNKFELLSVGEGVGNALGFGRSNSAAVRQCRFSHGDIGLISVTGGKRVCPGVRRIEAR